MHQSMWMETLLIESLILRGSLSLVKPGVTFNVEHRDFDLHFQGHKI